MLIDIHGRALRTTDLAAPGDRRTLAGQVATRDRSWDGWSIATGWLPNPDPVLKALGTDIGTYRALRADAHVGGCIRRRKAAVRALDPQWEAAGTPARVLKSIQGLLADLRATPDPDEPGAQDGLSALIAEALDGALYGYQPIELTWERVGALLVPTIAQGKPPEWFQYDSDNRLRFRARDSGTDGEVLPPRKFLCARQEPSYANPYGLPDLSLVFWPVTFRKGGSKFWARWLERYGGTFMLGKLPRSAPASDYDALADRLAEMIEDAVGVIPDDGAVEPLEAGDKAGSSDAFERYLLYWRSEITIALLGSNQGMETDSTHASAAASLAVGDDIRDADARMVEAVVNQLIRWTCATNWPGATVPRWVLREQEEIDQARPARDKILVEAGARLSRAYWLRTYDLEEGDLETAPEGGAPNAGPSPQPQNPNTSDLAAPLTAAPIDGQALIDAELDRDASAEQQAAMERLLQPILDALQDGLTPEECMARMDEWYGAMDDRLLTDLLTRGIAAAEAIGRLEVQHGH